MRVTHSDTMQNQYGAGVQQDYAIIFNKFYAQPMDYGFSYPYQFPTRQGTRLIEWADTLQLHYGQLDSVIRHTYSPADDPQHPDSALYTYYVKPGIGLVKIRHRAPNGEFWEWELVEFHPGP